MAFDLQNESDVKDYIEKLGIEYRFGCYSEKKPEGKKIKNFIMFSSSFHQQNYELSSVSSARRLSRKH